MLGNLKHIGNDKYKYRKPLEETPSWNRITLVIVPGTTTLTLNQPEEQNWNLF